MIDYILHDMQIAWTEYTEQKYQEFSTKNSRDYSCTESMVMLNVKRTTSIKSPSICGV